MITRYFNALILRQHKISLGEIWVQTGTIIPPRLTADQEIDVKGLIIAPGFIDIQVNGGFGVDFSVAPHRVDRVARQLPEYGVTSFLPTLVSLSPSEYYRCCPLLQPFSLSQSAENLGIHLEGPFIDEKYKGAHHSDCILSDIEQLDKVYGSLDGVKIITLAPELPGALFTIKRLVKHQIIVAIGHSNANQEQVKQAIEAGASLVTHLFNAMRPFHHRETGIIGEALTNHQLYYSLIVDGRHLSPETVQIAWKCHPKGLILVTDAVAALGNQNGSHFLGGQLIHVKNGHAVASDETTLAGGVITMDKAVKQLKEQTGCSLEDALEAASLKPAQLLKINSKKGHLMPGADADFIITDPSLHIHATYLKGHQYISLKENV